MGSMTMLWIRHGETALNAARVVQPADTPLSSRGLAQAAAVARHLRQARPAAIVSSDMPRALQTAEAIGRVTGLPVTTHALLQERNFGSLRGRAWDELGFDVSALVEAPEGGESLSDLHVRAAEAWRAVLGWRSALPGPLVVVSHGLLIHAVLQRHADWPDGLNLPERMANTSVSVVSERPPHAIVSVNDTGHLSWQVDTMPPC